MQLPVRIQQGPANSFHLGVGLQSLPESHERRLSHRYSLFNFDDCNVLHVGLPLEKAWKLQYVQKAVNFMLTGASRFQHITTVLRELLCLPIAFCSQIQGAVTLQGGCRAVLLVPPAK